MVKTKAQKGKREKVPLMRGRIKSVIAIFLADLHLTLNPPLWRSAEPDWLEAQCRPLEEVKMLQDRFGCPIFCAGDIYEWWFGAFGKGGAELTNYAINHLPDMYSIAGQHDLPLHQYEDIHKSAYWTLVLLGKINNMAPASVRTINDQMVVYSLPYGYPIEPCPEEKKYLRIAIVHDYVWIPGCKYPEASAEERLKRFKHGQENQKLYGYDIIVYGDNHKGFMTKVGKTTVFNCGTLMRRKSDEIDYKPQVGLLSKSGEMTPYYLDISKDKHLDIQMGMDNEDTLDMKSFFQELEKLGQTKLDFVEAVKQYCHAKKVTKETKLILLKAMEERQR